MDNNELSQVSIVGVIKKTAKLSTNITLTVADETGEIDVRQWLNAGEQQQDFLENMRVKVIGHVREFQERRSVLAFRIVPVESQEEATYHQLMATYVHLFNRFGALPEGGAAAAGGVAANNPYAANVLQAQHPNAGNQQAADVHRAVIGYVKTAPTPQGVSRNEIVEACKHAGQRNVIEEAIEHLCTEGQLYTTIDENHVSFSGMW